jgi:addiction module HigA family antidote
MSREIEYRPRIVSPPGDTLQELLDEMNLSQAEFAERTGHSQKTINEIIKGKAPISQETALNFEKVLGTSATFWNTREQHYREYLTSLQEQKRLENSANWLLELPIKELQKRGCIPVTKDKVALIKSLLSFFAVANELQWRVHWNNVQANFRASASVAKNLGAVAAWLRIGEKEGNKIECKPYNEEIFLSSIQKIRSSILVDPNWELLIRNSCSEAGVAVVFVKSITGTGLYGCARWLSPEKALIQLSMRGKRDDQFWFTFFHETTHILKHKKKALYLEDADQQDEENFEEKEANEYARNILIPIKEWDEFINGRVLDASAISFFAEQQKLTRGIIVGRLQREKRIAYNKYQNLKMVIDFIE